LKDASKTTALERMNSGPSRCLVILAALWLAASTACRAPSERAATDVLSPCQGADGPTDAYCGRLEVFENRDARSGRKISLKIVVWPALSPDPEPDPLVFLAGGPGQGAARLARQARDLFSGIQADRDIVLVDQRGTGDSGALECRFDDLADTLASLAEPDEQGLARLRHCLAGYDADVRLYTTPIAMDDLDDVRSHLGYERINVYGGSYGTRAALVYLRQHGARVRTIVLDGVAPQDMRLPAYFARDAQRALDRLLEDCASDPACAAKYPNLAGRVRALFAQLESAPPSVRLVHPRTGRAETVRVDATLVANLLFGALYSPFTSSIVPELIARAEQNDFQGLVALAFVDEMTSASVSVGMQLSVTCAEDVPRIAPGEMERASAGTLFAHRLLTAHQKACAFWPRGEMPAGYYEPVESDVPALLLSGDVDPVTPPSWAELAAARLTNATHLTAPFTAHGVVGTGCGRRLVQDFVERGSAEGLDTSCLRAIKRPPFFLSPAGADVAGETGSARP
jgi:pimeloyl-ACP methyl ester carboxylesterase